MRRVLGVGLLLLAPVTANADKDLEEVPVWGTISVERDFHPPDIAETFNKGDPYYPGTRLITESAHWSYTYRYLPGKKQVATAALRYRRFENRRTDDTELCGPGGHQRTVDKHDYETSEKTKSAVGSVERENKLSLFVTSAGEYKLTIPDTPFIKSPTGEKSLHTRDTQYGCRPDMDSFIREPHTSSAQFQSTSGEVHARVEKRPFDVFASTEAVPVRQSDGSMAMVTWNLTRSEPKVIAHITGPASFRRGDVVKLDGKKSEGKIVEYRWRVGIDPETCKGAGMNAAKEWTGPELSFQALCDFTAQLEVKDAEGVKDRDRMPVPVIARDDVPWKTHFKSEPGPPITAARLTTLGQQLGMNRCSYKSHGDTSDKADHVIHNDSKDSKTWIDDGYVVKDVSDGGPFNGMFYVKTQMLDINRFERVNADLLPKKTLDVLNTEKKNGAAALLLFEQVAAHEGMHSRLMKEALDHLGDDEPARLVEKITGGTKDSVQSDADVAIRGAQTILAQASLDAKVQARLHALGIFDKNVDIWLPGDAGGAPALVHLGPAWALGDSK